MPFDRPVQNWRDIQTALSTGERDLKDLTPSQLQLVALAQLVSTGQRLTRTTFGEARAAGGTVIIHGRSEEQTRAAIASPSTISPRAIAPENQKPASPRG